LNNREKAAVEEWLKSDKVAANLTNILRAAFYIKMFSAAFMCTFCE
jgi:hypothetical protein